MDSYYESRLPEIKLKYEGGSALHDGDVRDLFRIIENLKDELANAPRVIPASEIEGDSEVLFGNHWLPVHRWQPEQNGTDDWVRLFLGEDLQVCYRTRSSSGPDLVCVRPRQEKSKVEVVEALVTEMFGNLHLSHHDMAERIVKALEEAAQA